MRQVAPNFSGISYEKMEESGGIQWPCLDGSEEEISDITPMEELAAGVKGAEESGLTTVVDDIVENDKGPGTLFLHAELWEDDVKNRAPFPSGGLRRAGRDAGRGVSVPANDGA